ncbi:UPF0142 protein [Salmonella enterica subsp. enterica]|uniref:UPF0142 protein n=1 Tax=Salmonella enterica I TaxID=59201 RepID=A0A447MV29_SALET|nr:UPF0142 protein [Salmonella enterica subsp. enterica]
MVGIHCASAKLKAMLALAGGDLEQALIWTEWTMEFNSSVFSPARANYYRCLQTLLLLSQEDGASATAISQCFYKNVWRRGCRGRQRRA